MCSGCEAQVIFVYPSTTLKKKRKPIAAHFRIVRSGHKSGCANATTKTRARVIPRTVPSVFRLVAPRSNALATPSTAGSSNRSQGVAAQSGKVGGAGKSVTNLAGIAQKWHENPSAVSSLPLAIPNRVAATYGALFTALQGQRRIPTDQFAVYFSDTFTTSEKPSTFLFEFPVKSAGNRRVKVCVQRHLLMDEYDRLLAGAAQGLRVTLYVFGEFKDKGSSVARLDVSDKRAIHVEP
jgi:hypothetical protein